MAEEPKVVIRDGQLLSGNDLFADFDGKEVVVTLDEAAKQHSLIAGLPDNEHGQSVQSPREAVYRASAAATHAQARGSKDAHQRILVTVEDLIGTE